MIAEQLRSAGSVFAEDEAALLEAEAASDEQLVEWVARRVAGEPLQYIVGWAEFCGKRMLVAPGVFVPRLRSEFLVRTAIPLTFAGSVVVDMCCGVGAIGSTITDSVGGVELYAVDIDPVAVTCATHNIVGGRVLCGDLFHALPGVLRGSVDLIVANAPYVPTEDVALMPVEARQYERLAALDGGEDGLVTVRRIISEAPGWLAPGGSVVIETSRAQAPDVVALAAASRMQGRSVYDAELDATMVIAHF